MIYSDIIYEITRAVADPKNDDVYERAKDHFLRAISTLIYDGDYTQDDIPGFINMEDIDFSDGTNTYQDLSTFDILTIDDVMVDPSATSGNAYEQTVSFKSFQEIRNTASNAELGPEDNEIIVYRVGDKLYPILSSGNAFTLGTDTLKLVYVSYPDDSDWDSDTVMTGANFSQPFLDKAIALASSNLAAEVGNA